METAEIRQLIQTGIPDSELIVSGEGCSFSVVVIADEFDGMSPVKRQQKVLATVSEPLSTGALHALSMRVYTSSEWRVEQEKQTAGS
jgi:acid stress-induced BolA-like protein IbaG/YrbA